MTAPAIATLASVAPASNARASQAVRRFAHTSDDLPIIPSTQEVPRDGEVELGKGMSPRLSPACNAARCPQLPDVFTTSSWRPSSSERHSSSNA